MPFIWYYNVNFDLRMRNWCFYNSSIVFMPNTDKTKPWWSLFAEECLLKYYILRLSLFGKEVILAQSVKEFDSTSIDNHISTIQCHSLACPKLSEIDLFSVGVCLKLLLTRVFPVLVTPINDWQCGHPLLYALFVSYNTFKTLPRESFVMWRSMTPFL